MALPYTYDLRCDLERSLVTWFKDLGLLGEYSFLSDTSARNLPDLFLDLEHGLRNGTFLCELTQKLTGVKPILAWHRSPRTRDTALSNLDKVMAVLQDWKPMPRPMPKITERLYAGDWVMILYLLENMHRAANQVKTFPYKLRKRRGAAPYVLFDDYALRPHDGPPHDASAAHPPTSEEADSLFKRHHHHHHHVCCSASNSTLAEEEMSHDTDLFPRKEAASRMTSSYPSTAHWSSSPRNSWWDHYPLDVNDVTEDVTEDAAGQEPVNQNQEFLSIMTGGDVGMSRVDLQPIKQRQRQEDPSGCHPERRVKVIVEWVTHHLGIRLKHPDQLRSNRAMEWSDGCLLAKVIGRLEGSLSGCGVLGVTYAPRSRAQCLQNLRACLRMIQQTRNSIKLSEVSGREEALLLGDTSVLLPLLFALRQSYGHHHTSQTSKNRRPHQSS